MNKIANVSDIPMNQVNRHWGWVLGLGIVFLILGLAGLGMLVGLTLFSMFFFAVLLFIAAISHIVDVFQHKHWKGAVWQALIAILYLIAGFLVISDPFLASALMTALLAGVLIIIGITRICMAIVTREYQGWVWTLFAGICAFLLGLLILIQWPISGLWAIGLFIAVEMLVTGWTYIFIAFALKE